MTTGPACLWGGGWRITRALASRISSVVSRSCTDPTTGSSSPVEPRAASASRLRCLSSATRNLRASLLLSRLISRKPVTHPLRVLIVDDEKPARQRLAALLERQPAVRVTAACAGGEAAIEAASNAARSGVPVDIIF